MLKFCRSESSNVLHFPHGFRRVFLNFHLANGHKQGSLLPVMTFTSRLPIDCVGVVHRFPGIVDGGLVHVDNGQDLLGIDLCVEEEIEWLLSLECSFKTTNGPHEMMNTKPMDPSHGSHGHSSQSIMHNGHMMMFFHGGYEEVILFDVFWRINTLGGLIWMIVSYLLMLIFMTYNSWLCLSVIVGTGAGYFFFGWKRSSILDVSDHCH
ncbi:SLC31A1 [Lepeophtheirus salmonis]|uniref:Copper transport protein n=1 Tax=Lepeophtheirus salmonis TaxID=72036 RepID=A0A7R8D7Q7_LEPSM|nr:SLC31A1 [Lepeophtheirus salmonis]CAF3027758.1 SLC31A1 [Lepeophtheirus salmonis]